MGHTQLSITLSQCHAVYVLEEKALLFALLAGAVLRDRILWPELLGAVSADTKFFMQATFPCDDSMFISFIVCLHSWRYKEEDTSKALFELNKNLSSKKLLPKPIYDWQCCMER